MLKTIVTTTIVSRHDTHRFIQFPIEVDDALSLEEVHDKLVRDGSIFGQRVNFTFLPNGLRVVTERTPQIVTLAGVAAIGLCPYEYFEADEVGTDE